MGIVEAREGGSNFIVQSRFLTAAFGFSIIELAFCL